MKFTQWRVDASTAAGERNPRNGKYAAVWHCRILKIGAYVFGCLQLCLPTAKVNT